MNTFSSYSSSVLVIKSFPLIFNDNDRKEFLEHFGAVRVHCLSRFKNLTNLIVADFGSGLQAAQAIKRLHQLEILNRRLAAEYCPLELANTAFSTDFYTYNEIEDNLLHGISPGRNQIVYALPSERLSYAYPPIDNTILTNINNALLSIPAFYTQVLHLMNKMSLPCPMITDANGVELLLAKFSVACQTDESFFSKVVDMDTDDDESEIDDGEEEERMKRRSRSILRSTIHQGITTTTPVITVNDTGRRKKSTIELKLPSTLDSSRTGVSYSIPIEIITHGFGHLEPKQSTITVVDRIQEIREQLSPLPLISLEEIERNRLTENQLRLIDDGRLYRNYDRGQPSQRLYIKNIDTKHVDERILHSIYDRYKQDANEIDIRLMREGKMKGQAFVTLPNEEIALCALNDTNGFILYERPMIVQFARSAKPKDSV